MAPESPVFADQKPFNANNNISGAIYFDFRHNSKIRALLAQSAWVFWGYLRVFKYSSRHLARLAGAVVFALAGIPAQAQSWNLYGNGSTLFVPIIGRIKDLDVISRTSAMLYRNSPKRLPEIARELSVDAVIQGSVLRDGNRVRISAQLIDAAADRHLWANEYERDVQDVLALQRLGDIVRRQPKRRHPVGTDPDPHAVVERAEQIRVTDTRDPLDAVQHIDRGVVAEEQRVVALVRWRRRS